MRRFTILIFGVLINYTSYSQINRDKKTSTKTFDHIGKKLSRAQLDSLFKDEDLQFQNAENAKGTVTILNKIKRDSKPTKKQIPIGELLGKFDRKLRSEYQKLSITDFKKYYNSLSNHDKYDFLSSATSFCLSVVKKDSALKDQIHRDYSELIETTQGFKNSNNINLINLMIYMEHEGLKNSLVSFFENIKIEDNHYQNNTFLRKLIEFDETLAFKYFKKLKLIDIEEKNESKTLSQNIPLTYSFLTIQNRNVRNDFVKFVIDKKLSETSILLKSGKLSSEEKKSVTKKLLDSKEKNSNNGEIDMSTLNQRLELSNRNFKSLSDFHNLFNKAGLYEKISIDSLILANPIMFDNYITLHPLVISRELFKKNTDYVHISAESGEFPNQYDQFLNYFIPSMNKKFNLNIEFWQEVNFTNQEKSQINNYNIYISYDTLTYKIKLPDTGDWYSPNMLIQTLNHILKNIHAKERWNRIGKEEYIYVLMSPESFQIIDASLNFENL